MFCIIFSLLSETAKKEWVCYWEWPIVSLLFCNQFCFLYVIISLKSFSLNPRLSSLFIRRRRICQDCHPVRRQCGLHKLKALQLQRRKFPSGLSSRKNWIHLVLGCFQYFIYYSEFAITSIKYLQRHFYAANSLLILWRKFFAHFCCKQFASRYS